MSSLGIENLDLGESRADTVITHLRQLATGIRSFLSAADGSSTSGNTRSDARADLPNQYRAPSDLQRLLNLHPLVNGGGAQAMFDGVERLLKYSVNVWDRGLLSKSTACPDSAGILADTLLGVLNTTIDVYTASPALTLIERHVTKELCRLFELSSPHAGGISQPGSDASNLTSLVVARNTIFPRSKSEGLHGDDRKYVIFTSQHSHDSAQKAAYLCGLGTKACRLVPCDAEGRMSLPHLEFMIAEAKDDGETPFYVNATAGTSVLGAFDPLREIGRICKREKLWFHVDATWGGAFMFSERLKKRRLDGIELADSIAFSPHSMLGVPVSCSFLLGRDLRMFRSAFGADASDPFRSPAPSPGTSPSPPQSPIDTPDLSQFSLFNDRRAESLKLLLSWTYHGSNGYSSQLESAYLTAQKLALVLPHDPRITMISKIDPLPCLQICFYWTKDGTLSADPSRNSVMTRDMQSNLRELRWIVDEVPGPKGHMLRLVVNRETTGKTAGLLLDAVRVAGERILAGE